MIKTKRMPQLMHANSRSFTITQFIPGVECVDTINIDADMRDGIIRAFDICHSLLASFSPFLTEHYGLVNPRHINVRIIFIRYNLIAQSVARRVAPGIERVFHIRCEIRFVTSYAFSTRNIDFYWKNAFRPTP